MNQEKLASALKYFKDGKWSAAADAFWDIKDQITQPMTFMRVQWLFSEMLDSLMRRF